MITVFSPDHALHAPHRDLIDGEMRDAVEIPRRAEIVRAAVEAAKLGDIVAPPPVDLSLLQAVHAPDYLAFLGSVGGAWQAAGRPHEAFPHCWPVPGLRRREPRNIDGRLGFWSFDVGTPIGLRTWEAALSAAASAAHSAALIAKGRRSAFALCRPPGHHAHRDLYGGYCFLNNAAVAAEALRRSGAGRVAILDVDYHHGNGTQAIFESRADVLFLSIHADPADEFPYFLGHADEIGVGEGEGFTTNYPLRIGTDWATYETALAAAAARIAAFGPDALIVSLGLDAYERDPISRFRLTTEDFRRLGSALGRMGRPTLYILEGGYAVAELGDNAVAVLAAAEDA